MMKSTELPPAVQETTDYHKSNVEWMNPQQGSRTVEEEPGGCWSPGDVDNKNVVEILLGISVRCI